MVNHYVPHQGDIVLLNFEPQAGKEQAGSRPALVMSSVKYNEKVGLALCCPITRIVKGYPFEVLLLNNLKTEGVILSDHIKNLDWKVRNARYIEKVPRELIQEVSGKISLLLEIEENDRK